MMRFWYGLNFSNSAWNNWFQKHRLSVYYTWLRDLVRKYGNLPSFQAMLPGYEETLKKALSDDATMWQGWFSRHNGEVVFLGDDAAAWSGALQVLLAVLFIGLVGGAWWRAG